jgi:hypothetical protein
MAWWSKDKTAAQAGGKADDTSATDALIAEAVRLMSKDPDTGAARLRRPSDKAEAPTRHRERDEWAASQVRASFRLPSTASVYQLDEALSAAIAEALHRPDRCARLLEGPDDIHSRNERDALAICARYAMLARGGSTSLMRIDAEADALTQADDASVFLRLEHTPPVRMDPVPADHARRRHWLRETLAGEATAISTGMMSPAAVARAAVHARFPVRHDRPDDGARIEIRFPAYHADSDVGAQRASQAGHMAEQDDTRLLARFGTLPGCMPPPSEGDQRVRWVAKALTAETLRRSAALDNQAASIPIDLADIEAATDDGVLVFTGQLVVAGERICRITSPGAGEITADEWSEGASPADLEALDMVLAATGESRDGGETPDSLAARLLDRVAMHLALRSYREAAATALVFTIEEDGEPAVMTIPIPEGGTRDGARTIMLEAYPRAVVLDDMPDEDAALLWVALS